MLKKLSEKLFKSFNFKKKAKLNVRGFKKSKNILEKVSLPLILIVIAFVLAVQNYTPGTFLSGWDTLHPEFDYRLNLARTLTGVFRTEQGLGAIASHAHMVEITRILMLWLYDIFLPQNMLRYAYFFTTLVAGPLGMYFFLKNVFFKRSLPSFLGALFYMLNLGTYQIFAVPFEMFAALYATLPWFFLTFDMLLRQVSRKNVAFFSLVTLFASQAAYASSLWYLFFGATLLYFTPFVILKLGVEGILKRFLIAISLVFLINSYWILPNVYFAVNDAKHVTNANINKLFSEEAFLKNKEFGNISDILQLKSFYFDWSIYNFGAQKFEQITEAFATHLSGPIVSNLAFFYAAIFIFGFFIAVKRYKALSASFILVVLFSFIFLFNNNPPFSPLFNFLQENMPLFKEALRFPHNKIHNVFIFFVAIFFAVGIDFFIINFRKILKTNLLSITLVFLVSASLIYYMLPAFKGNLINPHVKSSLPEEYFEMFDYLSNEPNGRMANLPVHSPWGWVYNKWDNSNFQGAGFLYFGIKQSLLDRDFDRWNPLNEQYYLEMSNAIYSEDKEKLLNVIDKYDISYLMLDKSVINPGSESKALYISQIQKMLDEITTSNSFISKNNFGKYLTVYEIAQKNEFPLTTLPTASNVSSYQQYYYTDRMYDQFGEYVDFKADGKLAPLSFINNESKVDKSIIKIEENHATINLPDKSKTNLDLSKISGNITSKIVGQKTVDGQFLLDIYPSYAKLDATEIISPIHNQIILEDNSIVAVNENVIYLDNVSTTPTVLATATLTPTQNAIASFDRNSDTTLSYYLPSVPVSYSYCGNENNSKILSIVKENSLSIQGKLTDDYCLTIPLSIFSAGTSTNLGQIMFEFPYSNGLSACLVKNGESKCYYNIPVKNVDGQKTIEFAVPESARANSNIRITIGSGEKDSLDLKNMTIDVIPSRNETFIDSNYFDAVLPESFSTVSLPFSQDSSTFFEANEDTTFENECDDKNVVSKKIFQSEANPYFEYSSATGSYCDHIPFESLSHTSSYLVVVKSQNIEGLPLTFCITNYSSRRCDIFAKLSSTTGENVDIFYLPSTDNGVGYDVNIENRSVKKSPSVNRLYSVQFIPIHDELVASVLTGNLTTKEYAGKIENARRLSTSTLLVETNNNPTLIQLSYGYHKGFNAYKVACNGNIDCLIQTFLAPITKTPLPHGKGSSWNNVWEYIPTGNANEKVMIIFMPQYLQYIGMGLLGIPLFYLLLPFLAFAIEPFFALDRYFKIKSNFYKTRVKQRLFQPAASGLKTATSKI